MEDDIEWVGLAVEKSSECVHMGIMAEVDASVEVKLNMYI